MLAAEVFERWLVLLCLAALSRLLSDLTRHGHDHTSFQERLESILFEFRELSGRVLKVDSCGVRWKPTCTKFKPYY